MHCLYITCYNAEFCSFSRFCSLFFWCFYYYYSTVSNFVIKVMFGSVENDQDK